MTGWQLPVTARIGEKDYNLHTDYRDILEIFSYLDDPDLPELFRWRIALGLFFEGEIPPEDVTRAAEYFVWFVNCGQSPQGGEPLISWQQDGAMIAAEINKASGQEIRSMPYLHWWTFLGWFHTIGQGQLSTVVSLRSKLRRGQPLEPRERQFYREHRSLVDLPRRYSRQELLERQKLQQLLE